jgi:hypothetical protein
MYLLTLRLHLLEMPGSDFMLMQPGGPAAASTRQGGGTSGPADKTGAVHVSTLSAAGSSCGCQQLHR